MVIPQVVLRLNVYLQSPLGELHCSGVKLRHHNRLWNLELRLLLTDDGQLGFRGQRGCVCVSVSVHTLFSWRCCGSRPPVLL